MLECKNIELSLSGSNILKGVHFAISKNEVVGLIGPNGSGKTTLFNVISGFLRQQQGEIHLAGERIENLRPYQRAQRGLGRVFQNFGIFKEMSLMENLLAAIESKQSLRSTFLPWSKQCKKNREHALTLLERIGLADHANAKAASLSGGQMRLLEIIRLVAFDAHFLLLDEPTAGVSPKMKQEVSSLIESIADKNRTVFIIEHDMNFIKSICKRILVMDSGIITMDGSPQEVRDSPQLQEIYFGT